MSDVKIQLDRMRRLSKFNLELTSTISLKPLLQKIVAAAAQLTDSEMAAILLLDELGGGLRFITASTMVDKFVKIPVPIENSIAGTALISGEVIIVDDARADVRHYKGVDQKIERQTQTLLTVPLQVKNRSIGVIEAENKQNEEKYDQDDVEILTILAAQAAVAIENARLVKALQETHNHLEIRVKERTAELSQANTRLKEEIVERKRAEIEAQEARQKAEIANQTKSEFLANMSHELRSPLSIILGFSQIMSDSSTISIEDQENLRLIMRNGDYLLTLINQVLDLSKIEAGRVALDKNDFDLYRLLDDIADMFGLKADHKDLQLNCMHQPDVPRYVYTDEVKLRQVLINLLSNAIKFTQKGSVTLQVKQLERDKNHQSSKVHLIFEVSDTGPGISPEEMDQLFKAFTQTETGRQTHEGTGLGLVISRQFVRLMEGDIVVKSDVGQGTTFKFDIQIESIEASKIHENKSKALNRVVALEPEQPRYRILIVDDKWHNRHLLVKLLTPFNFELRQAENGLEAVKVWEIWQPHLIWMDMRMPVMDGYEATRQIKSKIKAALSRKNHQIKTVIIAITASFFEEERPTVLLAGCDDFLRKPFWEADIFEMMHKHIGIRYIYENLEDEHQSLTVNDDMPVDKVKSEIAILPLEILSNLKTALIMCSMDSIERTIDEIRRHNVPLANRLAVLANSFDYNKILELLQ